MFIQVIEGEIKDLDAVRESMQRWQADLAPGATGWLGGTYGVTDDGRLVAVVRFDSEQSARANSDRAEQAEWWSEMAAHFVGDVSFRDYPDVVVLGAGGSDDAGFVQVMHGRALDPETMRKAGVEMEDALHQMRPEILGGLVAWHGDRNFTQVMYFASEDEARAAETASSSSEEMNSWSALLDGPLTFFDLHDPQYL